MGQSASHACAPKDRKDAQEKIEMLQEELLRSRNKCELLEAELLRWKEGPEKRSEIASVEKLSSRKPPANNPVSDSVPEFLNEMLKYMWPYISAYVTNTITAVVEPAIQTKLDALKLGIRASLPRESCHLGTRHVEFTSMSVDSKKQQTDDGEMENLVLRSEIEWLGDLSIYMKFGWAAGLGVNRLTVKGVLFTEFVGMKPCPPMFKGLRVFFINPPEVDLGFQGMTKVLNMDFLKQILLDVITEQISNAVVLPNKMGSLMDNEADVFRILKPCPDGVLTITIKSANGLRAMDINFLSAGTSDPFVVVRCGALKFKSSTVYKTCCPEFSFDARLLVDAPHHQRLSIELFDEDIVSQSDFLGKAELSVEEMVSWGEGKMVTIELADKSGKTGEHGTIMLGAVWRPLVLDRKLADTDMAGLLFAGVYWASGFSPQSAGTTFWVEAQCTALMPGSKGETLQATKKLAHASVEGEDKAGTFTNRLELCNKHKMDDDEIAELLGVDKSMVLDANKSAAKSKSPDIVGEKNQLIQWDHAFQYLVGNYNESVLTLELKRQVPEKGSEPISEGKIQFEVAPLLNSGHGTVVQTVKLPDTGISLKLRLQLRFLGKSSNSISVGRK